MQKSALAGAPGQIRKRDGEYRRCGTANVFAVIVPKACDHLTIATANRKGPEFARMLNRISRRYPQCRRVNLITDNLNTHCMKSLTDYYRERRSMLLWRRFRGLLHPDRAARTTRPKSR